MHDIGFLPSNPDITFNANDGGIWKHDAGAVLAADATDEQKRDADRYRSANGNLIKTQFFNVAVSKGWPDPEPFINLGNPNPERIGGSTQDQGVLIVCYAGTGLGAGHVHRSEDGGVSWTDISGTTRTPTGRPGTVLTPELRLPDIPFVAIAQHAGRPETLYAAAEVGVFRTTTGGDSWAPFDEGLPNAVVSDLEYRAGTGELFVSTIGRGIWVRRV